MGQGHIGVHAQTEQRCLCHACHQTFSARQGTAFYRLRTAAETVGLVVTLRAHGGPGQAMGAALGGDERPGAAWWARSGRQGQAVHASLVEHPRDWGQVQTDALRVKTQGGSVWMALALMGQTRLGRGGAGRAQRDRTLLRCLLERVRLCAARRPLLGCPEGLTSYIRAMRETWRAPGHTGKGDGPGGGRGAMA